MPIVDILNQKFGRLTVIEKTNIRKSHRNVVWKCLCDCGKETLVDSGHLRTGHTKSCGCLAQETSKKVNIKHGCSPWGQKPTTEYSTWTAMKTRCTNPNQKDYKNYGGRGIKVCDDWLHSFENFLAYLKSNNMYPKPPKLKLDRIDSNKNYEPGNIRWANSLEQAHNRRCSKRN